VAIKVRKLVISYPNSPHATYLARASRVAEDRFQAELVQARFGWLPWFLALLLAHTLSGLPAEHTQGERLESQFTSSGQGHPPPTDYLASERGHSKLAVGGTEAHGCRLLAWDVPRSVSAGQQVTIEIGWQILHGDPGEAARATVIGEWDPDKPLRIVYGAFRDEPGTIVARRMSFEAPAKTGRFGLRWVLAFGPGPAPAYYGHASGQGTGSDSLVWCESTLVVRAAVPAVQPAARSELSTPPRDRLAAERPDSRLKPGELSAAAEFRLLTWSVPKVVRPGEVVRSSICWQTIDGNPNAHVFVSVIGEWDPDKPLALLHHGYQGEIGTTVTKPFSFVAPQTPGLHRIRWILAQAFKPITVFYGKEHNVADDPGLGTWAEVQIEVASTNSPFRDP
jgi:hypothetical protein